MIYNVINNYPIISFITLALVSNLVLWLIRRNLNISPVLYKTILIFTNLSVLYFLRSYILPFLLSNVQLWPLALSGLHLVCLDWDYYTIPSEESPYPVKVINENGTYTMAMDNQPNNQLNNQPNDQEVSFTIADSITNKKRFSGLKEIIWDGRVSNAVSKEDLIRHMVGVEFCKVKDLLVFLTPVEVQNLVRGPFLEDNQVVHINLLKSILKTYDTGPDVSPGYLEYLKSRRDFAKDFGTHPLSQHRARDLSVIREMILARRN